MKRNQSKPNQPHEYTAYFDGACEPVNPYGNLGIGAFIQHKKDGIVFRHSEFIPASNRNSNNVAEYAGLIAILDWFIDNGHTEKGILIRGDSMLVVKQMNKQWRIKFGLYVPYATIALEKISKFTQLRIEWIPRTMNEYADELSKTEMVKNKVEFRIQPQ